MPSTPTWGRKEQIIPSLGAADSGFSWIWIPGPHGHWLLQFGKNLLLWHFQKNCSITSLEQTPPIITMTLFLQQYQRQIIGKSHNLFMK
jgi:hypothetical protein